jgi:hypothetical protein
MAKSLLIKDEEFVTIVLHFEHHTNRHGVRQYKILSEKEAKDALANGSKNIDSITTKWTMPTWNSNSYILRSSTYYNPTEGTNKIDWSKYQDNLFKTCLREWDLIGDDDKPIPVNNDTIGSLPAIIAAALLEKYEKCLALEEEDRKK